MPHDVQRHTRYSRLDNCSHFITSITLFLLNAEDTKRGAQTRARTRGLGTNSRDELSLWGSCQLARTQLHGNEPAFVCGGASLLMLRNRGTSRAPPRCRTNWCQSQLWRRAPVKRTISEGEKIHVYTNPLPQAVRSQVGISMEQTCLLTSDLTWGTTN